MRRSAPAIRPQRGHRLGLSSGHFFIHTVALATAAWSAALVIVVLRLRSRIGRRSGPRAAAFDLFEKAHAIDVQLLALRASGDEAGLAIAFAQALRVVAVAALGILPGWMSGNAPRAGSEKAGGTRVTLGLSCIAAMFPLTVRYWETLTGAARLDIASVALAMGAVIAAWIEAAALLFALALFGVMQLSWLTIGSAQVLARATGPESLDLIAHVECEPVPTGPVPSSRPRPSRTQKSVGLSTEEHCVTPSTNCRRFVGPWPR